LVADYLSANAKTLFTDEVLSGDVLKLRFNDPLLPQLIKLLLRAPPVN
jgi:hypothetical protein